MQVQILIDNPNSWIIPYVEDWVETNKKSFNDFVVLSNPQDVGKGDVLIMLSCEKKFEQLQLNKYNLVVHESDLPKGRGMSPLTWQILEGKNEIVVSLLEASSDIDAGLVYLKTKIKLKGTELIEELRELQVEATFTLLNEFLLNFPNNIGIEQLGSPSYYARRRRIDSKLDVNKSIIDQFNLLRVVDNERYPAWFEYMNETYEIKIIRKTK
jgi:methionyl-tRNA formyltransferase